MKFSSEELFLVSEYLKKYYDCDKILFEPWKTLNYEHAGFIIYKISVHGRQPVSYTNEEIIDVLKKVRKNNE